MAIPTLDLTPFFEGTAADRDAVARQVDEAGRHLGFMRFAGHGFPIDLTAKCVAAAQEFFAKPAAFKRRYGPAKDGDFNGYWGPESELSGALFGSKTNFDLKEKFKISRPTDTGEYDPARPKIGWAYQPNRLPADPAAFAPTFLAYYAAMEATGKRVIRVMAAAVGTLGASARPLAPRGPASGVAICTKWVVMGGASAQVCSLYSSIATLRCLPSSS